MIVAREVDLHVGGRVLLQGMTFDLRPGELVAILGPNGVGKTTLLRAMAGTRDVDAGTLRIGDDDVARVTPGDRARRIAFMASDDLFGEHLTVRDVVAMGRYPYHRWWQWHEDRDDDIAIERALDAVRMREFERRAFATLSSGERQRIWLALGLAQEAPLLLLDEPTSHLDVRVAHAILALLRDQVTAGKTIVSVLHDLNEAAEFADRIMLLGCGRVLAFDTPHDVFASGLLEDAYGVPMETMRSPSGALRVFPRLRG
ncbi:MAG TPA: ABC transporter ATP-binding protein [Candidatus Baltobacteraceae bacterium]|jgi:iron complex transport system ATP-binding protein